ncbi:MAG: ribosome biogenesis GTP-binding protein YihA/YsxC [Nitrospirota bacterium]
MLVRDVRLRHVRHVMKVISAEFVKAAVDERGWPKDNLPQVAFAGRSNVGKSSLINSLVNRRGLVRTSSTPGKTREINFFLINSSFYFVDLPGFGFARVPGKVQESWGEMIEDYLLNSPRLRLIIFLLDIRHKPGENDVIMNRWLTGNSLPAAYAATKADKIARGARRGYVEALSGGLDVPPERIIQFSSVTGEGKDRLWETINKSII